MERPRFFAFVLALGIGCGFASAQARGIEVFWSDPVLLERKLPLAQRLAVEEEFVRIYREVGIAASFPSNPPLAEQDAELALPAFHVVLLARSGEGLRVSRQAMGAILEKTPTTRTVYVFLPVVLGVMGDPAGHGRKLVHDVRQGRALAHAVGRVVAHEVAHAIDPEMPHGPPDSLMSEHLTSRMLRELRLGFDDATAIQLRDGVDRIRREALRGKGTERVARASR